MSQLSKPHPGPLLEEGEGRVSEMLIIGTIVKY